MARIEEKVKKRIEKAVKKIPFKRDKIIVAFGCTGFLPTLLEELKEIGVYVSAIIDNDNEKQGKFCLGIQVYNPEQYILQNRKYIIVLICSDYYVEMKKQLESYGLNENIDYFILPCNKKNHGNGLHAFSYCVWKILKGRRICNSLLKKYSKTHYVIYCAYPGTGDIYVLGMLFEAYLKQNHIEKYVFVVANKACAKVATLFEIKNIEIISEKKLVYLNYYYHFAGDKIMYLRRLEFFGWYSLLPIRLGRKINPSFMELHRGFSMGLNKNCKVTLPKFDKQSVNKIITSNNIGSKAVMLAPYAGSFESTSETTEFWNTLATDLAKRGFQVFTNCNGETERAIENTIPIFLNYACIVPVLDNYIAFVGLRSGLCDIISTSVCKKIILYEDCFESMNMKFFSLNSMGLCDDAFEFLYQNEKNNLDVLKNKIIQIIDR